jgi:hypothetical protein
MGKMIRFNLWGIPAMACMLMMSSIGHGYEINTDFRNKYNRHLNITFFDLVI